MIGTAAALALGLLTLPVFMKSADPSVVRDATCKAEGPANLDLTLKDVNGADFKLSEQKGKVILMNFWATWCAPCLVEIPEFVKFYEEKKDKGFVIIGVLTEDSGETLKQFASERKMNYPLVINRPEMEDAYGPIFGLPTSVLIARDGSVCKRHFGPMSKEQLEREVKSLL
jgi:peroxiredoxin